MDYNRWSNEDLRQVQVWRREGWTVPAIAKTLGRSKHSVEHAIKRYSIPPSNLPRKTKLHDNRHKIHRDETLERLLDERDRNAWEYLELTPAQILMGDPTPSRSALGASPSHPRSLR